MSKKIYVLLLLLITASAYSQHRVNITLKNGDKLTGNGKVTKTGVNLKTSKGTRKIEGSEIERVVSTKKKKVVKHAFRPLKKGKKYQALPIIYTGNGIELYEIYVGKSQAGNVSMTVYRYYVYRDGEEFATMVSSGALLGKSFKQRAKEYFSDCPTLSEKIGNKGFKKTNLKKIIKYYEKNCG
jgi:hypothetical protein